MAGTLTATLGFMRDNLGLGEDHPNDNKITRWYGMTGPWCAMTVSRALIAGGFSSDGDTIQFPARTTTRKGWAYCPYMLRDLRDAGLEISEPHPGAVVLFTWYGAPAEPDHVGFVESVEADGTFVTLEGNQNDALRRVHRDGTYVAAFFMPPYAAETPAPPPAPPDSWAPSTIASVHLVMGHSGKLLTATGAEHGARVVQQPANGTLAQRWELWGHEDGTVSFVNRWGNLALDRPDNHLESGTPLQVAGVEFNPAQRWSPVGGLLPGLLALFAPGSNAQLDLTGADQSDGAQAQLWSSTMELPLWRAVKVVPTV